MFPRGDLIRIPLGSLASGIFGGCPARPHGAVIEERECQQLRRTAFHCSPYRVEVKSRHAGLGSITNHMPRLQFGHTVLPLRCIDILQYHLCADVSQGRIAVFTVYVASANNGVIRIRQTPQRTDQAAFLPCRCQRTGKEAVFHTHRPRRSSHESADVCSLYLYTGSSETAADPRRRPIHMLYISRDTTNKLCFQISLYNSDVFHDGARPNEAEQSRAGRGRDVRVDKQSLYHMPLPIQLAAEAIVRLDPGGRRLFPILGRGIIETDILRQDVILPSRCRGVRLYQQSQLFPCGNSIRLLLGSLAPGIFGGCPARPYSARGGNELSLIPRCKRQAHGGDQRQGQNSFPDALSFHREPSFLQKLCICI